MRGEPIPLAVPTQGVFKNVTPDQVPQGGLIDGLNCWLDIDGLYKPRFGYTPYITPGPNIGPIMGLWWWVNLDNTNQYLAVSLTDVATVSGSPAAWTTVTGTPSLTGTLNDPVQFVSYFQNNIINVIICNNNDPLKVWNTGQTTVLPLTPTVALAGTNNYTGTTNPTFATYPQNTQFFFTLANANTGAVTINLNGVGAQPAKKLVNGVITDFVAGDLQPNTTYNFSFDGTEILLGTNLLAPIARDITVVGGRVVAVNILTAPASVRNITQVVWTATFDMTVWPALAFYNLVDLDDPLTSVDPIGSFAAIVYGQQSATLMQSVGGVTDPFAFSFTPIRGVETGPASSASVVIAEGLHYYFATDGRIYSCDGTSAQSISDQIDPQTIADMNPALLTQVFGVYYAKQKQIEWWYPARDGSTGPTHAVLYRLPHSSGGIAAALGLSNGTFEALQTFSEVIRSGRPIASATGVRWQDLPNPWVTYTVPWSSFASINSQGVFLGTDAGQVHLFTSASSNDNGTQIPFFFVPSLLSAGPTQDLLLDSWEVFFKPSSAFELLTLDFSSLGFPLDTPVTLTDTFFDLSSSKTYGEPKAFPGAVLASQYARYIELNFNGVSFVRALAFGGGTIFVNKQQRRSTVNPLNKNL